MQKTTDLTRLVLLALLVSSATACGVAVNTGPERPYDDYYPFYDSEFGTYTVVRRPILVVDGWTSRAFEYRPYRGFYVRRHSSPVTVYTATKGDRTFEVTLTPFADSTRVEVRARRGDNNWDKKQAKELMGQILRDYK